MILGTRPLIILYAIIVYCRRQITECKRQGIEEVRWPSLIETVSAHIINQEADKMITDNDLGKPLTSTTSMYKYAEQLRDAGLLMPDSAGQPKFGLTALGVRLCKILDTYNGPRDWPPNVQVIDGNINIIDPLGRPSNQ